MSVSTPDLEADVPHLLAALLPAEYVASGDGQNVWPGPERPSQRPVPLACAFVTRSGDSSSLWGDGQWRRLNFQILIRGSREEYQPAEAKARATYDAMHLSGPFTGAVSGADYLDVRALSGPVYLGQSDNDAHLFACNFAAWWLG